MRLFFLLVCISISLLAGDHLYTIKAGLLSHSTGPVSSGREKGVDVNLEVSLKHRVLSAYPTFGADISTNSQTSFLYAGFNWETVMVEQFTLAAFVGGSVHDGDLNKSRSDKRQLGTRFLFRTAIEGGYMINRSLSLSLIYDHYSHTGIDGKPNQGNDNIGFRVGFYF